MIARHGLADWAAPWLIAAAVTFNFGLCAVHTNLRGITSLEIIAVEAMILAGAAALGFIRPDILRSPWLLVFLLQTSWLVFLWVARGEAQLKPLRDAVIMPLFILVGMSAWRLDIARVLLRANLAILAFAVFEALFVDNYLAACNVIDYFISKGSTPEFQRDISGTDLFVSGIRPNGRFLFELPGLHRLSSVFLEPVSLGMYAAISSMGLLAFRRSMGTAQLCLGLLTSLLLIWLSDGRMALGVLLLCILVAPVIERMPAWFAIFIVPAALLTGWTFTLLGLGAQTGEGTARFYTTMAVLSQIDFGVLAGLGGLGLPSTVDTGLGYLLETQGLVGFMIFWLAPILICRDATGPAKSFIYFLSIYFGAGFLLSGAQFTIKTAPLLWFVLGHAVITAYQRAPQQQRTAAGDVVAMAN